ncbi:MarR family transcriptional regulator [uncultured Phenylobacterium sp.]|uniref:MarR family winged helix-turn-helix transcriptional regulator n=1 Tax=uncultured Phenylobacterium sp. TaxID=349273 RepID=UPI0025E7B214|nr:MarR family transcriptional regulator [uncultured Phenylobacterium sp.]
MKTEEYQALGAFRQALREFLAFSGAGSRALGLSPQQHQALLAVRAHVGVEPMSIGELADCLLIKNHSAVGLVARLVERGLMVRTPSTFDRRRVVLSLTPDAVEQLETISRSNLGELNRASDIFRELMGALRHLDADGLLDRTPPAKD